MPMTPEERSLRASIAGNSRWAATDRTAASAVARERRIAHHEQLVDPDELLHPEERRDRAVNSMRAEMQRLALKSAKARRLRAEAARLEEQVVSAGGAA